jgi:hypothetical protein
MVTKFIAKLLGLWMVLTMLGMAADKTGTVEALNGFFNDPGLMWVTGVFTMLVGLAIVVGHNRWSGGALRVAVTIVGWVILIKGLAFVWLPPTAQTLFHQSLHFAQFYYAYLVVAFVVGACLIYGGFSPTATERP